MERSSPSELPRSRKRAKYTQLAWCVPPYCNLSSYVLRGIVRLSNKFRTVDQQIEALHREMRAMSARMRELESASATPSASHNASVSSSSVSAGLQRIMNRPVSPDYVGPTSAEFGIIPRQKPAAAVDESDVEESDSTSAPSPAAVSDVEAMSNDPLGCLGKEEALRLVMVYENNVGVMYPCIDLDSVRSYVHDYYKDGNGPGPAPSGITDQDWFFARDVEVLKILLATALLAESHGRSERAALLADSVEDRFATRIKIPEVDMKELLILTLLSIFHSYRDDEVISWRLIGMAVRGSMQLGLHRQETWLRTGGVFPGELQWTFASRLFWCIYVLDRKWSFGTGLPFAIQDSDMDTNLPEPGAATPYLTCMINYARLSTKIWGLVMGWRSRPKAATSDYCSYLDFQVQQWIQSIPRSLRFDPSPPTTPETGRKTDTADSDSTGGTNNTMLQVLLALQANQLRILVYRQNLMSTESIETNASGALVAVETAKSTVHMLDYFSRVSDIYFQRPEPFNYFLISALAALFLAVLHAPARFSQVCRNEFYAAVDMVRRSSTRARTSRRLQKIIRSLKLIRLGLDVPARRSQQQTPGSSRVGPRSGGTELEHCSGSQSRTRNGSIDTLPFNHTTPSAVYGHGHGHGSSYRQHQRHPNSTPSLLIPQPSHSHSNSFWPISSPQTSTRVDENSCEDLTSFFEMAGGLYFDPSRVDPTLNTGTEAGITTGDSNSESEMPSQGALSDALGAFEAEDEALTRVMAGLL
ncbi:hypothetical protein BDW66DRAFT_168112 [Aspergillus desertorum]